MSDLDAWYLSEVEKWRTGASVAWTVLLLPVFTFVALTLVNIDLLKPHAWVYAGACQVFSRASWSYLVIMGLVIAVVGLWDAKHFSVRPKVFANRLTYIWNVVSPHRLLQVAGHGLAASILTWCFITMTDGRYKGLSYTCPHDESIHCLNEQHLFLIFHGIYVGLVYALQLFLTNKSHLTFPVIQQSKFFQVKSALWPLLISSLKHILWQMRFFYLAYYLFIGSMAKPYITSSLKISEDTAATVNTWSGMMDVSLLCQTLLSGTLVYFMLSFSALLYRIYQTEAFAFPIESNLEEEQKRCLMNALSCNTHLLVQYLAFQDLYLLAKHSVLRRSLVFWLSQPGGHPHNWKNISSVCLLTLQKLTESVKEFNNKTLTSSSVRQISGDKTSATGSKGLAPGFGGGNGSSLPGSSLPGSSLPGGSLPGTPVANLSYRGPIPVPATGFKDPSMAPKPGPSLSSRLWEQLKKRKAIAFFIQDLADTPSKRLFVDCQLHIWAVEAVSYLTAASYKEDSYGVVQNSLAEILTTLLALHEAVEKHLRLAPPNINRKGSKPSQCNSDIALRFALRSSLKSAIYRIVITFTKHLSSIPLSVEHCRKLRQFQEYKE